MPTPKRSRPGSRPRSLSLAAKLAESLALYRDGNRTAARDAATSAYLEGFELVENSLDNVDKPLRLEIEREMLALRAAIADGAAPAALEARVAKADALLASAQGKLDSGELSPAAAFTTSLVILLREGLEAILLLAAIIAFVTKTGRRDALPYVHAGWIAALLAGAATWVAANSLIDISGANRELTEGVTALIAAAMLLYVGYWLHGKSQAQAWTAFIRDSVGGALEKKTLWAMAGVSFHRRLPRALRGGAVLRGALGAGGRCRPFRRFSAASPRLRCCSPLRAGECSSTACACRSDRSSRSCRS